MRFHRTAAFALSAGFLAMALSACGSFQAARAVPPIARVAQQVEAKAVPPQSAFVTIKVTVKTILPDDNTGLPHQNFVVTELSPTAGLVLQVNNDTKFGSKVPLKVGDSLTIRGVTYGKPTRPSGIHWTHKADDAGDAGFIQTADGTKYE